MEKTQEHLDFFISHIPKIIPLLDGKDLNPIQRVALGMLKRLEHASHSLKLILDNKSIISHLDLSAGITIRAIILDMLIGLNILKLIKDELKKNSNTEELREKVATYCNMVLADGLTHTFRYVELAGQFGFANKKEVAETVKNFFENFGAFFESYHKNGKLPASKYPKSPGAAELFKNIAVDEDLRNISRIYDLYLFYSKYDHFGILYFTVEDDPANKKLERLKRAVQLFVRHCANMYDLLDRSFKDNQFVEKQYRIAGEYLLANKD